MSIPVESEVDSPPLHMIQTGNRWVALSVVLALIPSVLLLFIPLPFDTPGGGPFFIALLVLPVLIAALPLALARTRYRTAAQITAATLLLGLNVVAATSIGLFYFPSMMVAAIAAAQSFDQG